MLTTSQGPTVSHCSPFTDSAQTCGVHWPSATYRLIEGDDKWHAKCTSAIWLKLRPCGDVQRRRRRLLGQRLPRLNLS